MTSRMRPLRLSFANAHARRGTPARWLWGHGSRFEKLAGAAALALSLALLAATGWRAGQASQAQEAAREAVRRSAAAASAVQARATQRHAGSSPTRVQTAGWNQAVQALNVPWSAMLDALEHHTPAGVALVSVEPEPQQGRVRLQAEARSLDALLAYAIALRDTAGFQGVTVLRHETREQDPMQPVRLTFEVELPQAWTAVGKR